MVLHEDIEHYQEQVSGPSYLGRCLAITRFTADGRRTAPFKSLLELTRKYRWYLKPA